MEFKEAILAKLINLTSNPLGPSKSTREVREKSSGLTLSEGKIFIFTS